MTGRLAAAQQPPTRSVAVLGAGWSGLAAAVHATQAGHRVTLFEMARHAGGRARTVSSVPPWLDNGQHILIGAYTDTLALMRTVGADPHALLLRCPLSLTLPDGSGLQLPAGHPLVAFSRGVWATQSWTPRERLALLLAAAGWLASRFRCGPDVTVQQLTATLPGVIVRDLIEPLCMAALNTPMAAASGSTFLRVLRDALFAGQGSADLLLPRVGLSSLLPDPACAWLTARGAQLQLGHRIQVLQADSPPTGWLVDGRPFDAVVLACSAVEAARLTLALAPDWSREASAVTYEPIVTAYLHDPTLRLAAPMHQLRSDGVRPAQFIFDLHALSGQSAHQGVFAFVASSAATALQEGLKPCADLLLRQAQQAFGGHFLSPGAIVHVAAERRATFACTNSLKRPPPQIAPGLWAAGDYVAGPYPATLEGAVRSGLAAAKAVDTSGQNSIP